MPRSEKNKRKYGVFYFSIVFRCGDIDDYVYESEDPEAVCGEKYVIEELTAAGIDDYVFQLETGTKAGKLHYQIFCHRSKACLPTSLGKYLGAHWQVRVAATKGINSLKNYCMKADSRVCGPWGKKPIYMGKDLQCMENPLVCQMQIMDMIIAPPDDRTINWIQCTGGHGKSKLAKFLCCKLRIAKAIPLGTAGQIKTNIITQGASRCYLIDLPRSQGKAETMQEIFAAIEEIKNGWVKSCFHGKFHELIMEPPHVFCFSNWKAPVHLMSKDRWKLFTITDDLRLESDFVPRKSGKNPNFGGDFILES